MYWFIHNIEEKIKRRKTHKKCIRCGLHHLKTEVDCPHCEGISDHELKALLGKRAKFRLSLGKLMALGAIAIMILLFYIN